MTSRASAQLTPDSPIDMQANRLDQTDVALAGTAFDIDWLMTDGYDVQFVRDAPGRADELSVQTWSNRIVVRPTIDFASRSARNRLRIVTLLTMMHAPSLAGFEMHASGWF